MHRFRQRLTAQSKSALRARLAVAAAAGVVVICSSTSYAAPSAADYRADAQALDDDIRANYAYLDRLSGGVVPESSELTAERANVHDADSLLRYAEDRLTSLADHHAITGRSFKDSWAVVPSYADLWIVKDGDAYRIDAVRDGSPAARAGVAPGGTLLAVNGVPIAEAVAGFWRGLGLDPAGERAAYAARVLAAGRRDRPRVLTIGDATGPHELTLPSLYASTSSDRPPLAVVHEANRWTIRFNNSLGDQGTIAAFDTALSQIPPDAPLTLDLTDTPSGGNTSVARAVMSWFVDRATPYQVHALPGEERETGVARQWIEEVLPRSGKRHRGPVTARVGRWTGSMGEGLGIGLQSIGAKLCGTRMAGLRGAVYDFTLPASGLIVKFPAERLWTVQGIPREEVVPAPCR